MTKKQYRSAMGKTVDMGALLLQNEGVKAVGNMGVNARGDVVDNRNRVIDKKTRQIQRQNRRTTNVSKSPITGGTVEADQILQPIDEVADFTDEVFENTETDTFSDMPVEEETEFQGGLAAALARSRTVKQELEKTPRQLAKEAGVKKI